MKKLTLVVMSLALLLVTATSSFASVVFGASGPYNENTPWTYNLNLAPGTDSALLTLNLQLIGNWNLSGPLTLSTKTYLDGFANGSPIPGIAELRPSSLGGGGYTVSGYIPLLDTKGGLYALELASSTPGVALGAFNVVSGSVATTPIPAAFLLLGSGLVGLFGVKRVRRGSAAA